MANGLGGMQIPGYSNVSSRAPNVTDIPKAPMTADLAKALLLMKMLHPEIPEMVPDYGAPANPYMPGPLPQVRPARLRYGITAGGEE